MSRTTSNWTCWRSNSEFQVTTCLIVVNDVYHGNRKYCPSSHLQYDENILLKYEIRIRYIRFELLCLRGKASYVSSVTSPLITHNYVMKFPHIKSELHKQACIPLKLRTLSTKNVYLSHLFPEHCIGSNTIEHSSQGVVSKLKFQSYAKTENVEMTIIREMARMCGLMTTSAFNLWWCKFNLDVQLVVELVSSITWGQQSSYIETPRKHGQSKGQWHGGWLGTNKSK